MKYYKLTNNATPLARRILGGGLLISTEAIRAGGAVIGITHAVYRDSVHAFNLGTGNCLSVTGWFVGKEDVKEVKIS